MKTLLIVLISCIAIAAAQNNCPGLSGAPGVNCTSASLCCGSGTINPSCLPADGSKQCCYHYAASGQCDVAQTCGGGGGPGASSYVTCGPAGSTNCDKGTGQGAFCTADKPTCCGYYGGYGFCCAAGCACNNSYYTCDCPAPSTPAPTTPAPTTPAPIRNNCPGAGGAAGVNCSDASLCCGSGTITPSCLPADGSKKCCTHFLASTQCDPAQTCGGGGGPGASSYAQCGPVGSTYCDKGTGQGAFCTTDKPTCCGYYGGYGFCCAPGCSCNNSYYTCDCPATPAPTTPAPTTPAPIRNNCPGAAGTAGVNCSDSSLCCGAYTMTPSCLPKDGSKKCCTHYLSATQCNPDETCGGSGGPGASSYAQCGPVGSTNCDKGTGQSAFCTVEKPTCCGYYGGFGFCCAPGCSCNNSYYTCDCPSTPAPTTPVPTTPAPIRNNCPGAAGTAGVNCSDASLCCGSGTMTPSCLPADGSKKCCTHFLASTQCDPAQTCGGGGGPGASSYAQCGPVGSTYCDKGTGQGAFCTTESPTCCGYYGGYGFCCAPGCTCNNTQYTCNCPQPTTKKPSPVPTTRKPTIPATTRKPTTPKPTRPPKTCKTKGPFGKSATCAAAQKCCGGANNDAFCCPSNKRCNNVKRTCV